MMDSWDVNGSIDHRKGRYKRCHEQITVIRDLLLKTSASLELLETDNNFLREQNEVLLQTKTGKMKRDDKDMNKKSSKLQVPSAAKGRVELSLMTLGRVQEKLSEFEKVAQSLRTALEEAKEQGRKMKAKLEQMERNFQREKKRNAQLENMMVLMENQSKRDASSRNVAKRRLTHLVKEIHGLTQGLSVHKCNGSSKTGNNTQEMSNLSLNSSPGVDGVPTPIKSSTPYKTADGTRTALPVDDTPRRSQLVIRWDFWHNYRQDRFPELAAAQEKEEEMENMWQTVYLLLGSIATVYFIYESVSAIPSSISKIFF